MGVDVTIIAATNENLGDYEFAKELSYKAAVAFDYDRFWISNKEGSIQRGVEYIGRAYGKHHAYQTNLWSRYFGPDYPRGDWAFLTALIDFLRYHVKGSDIWYLSDSDYTGKEYHNRPFTTEDQHKMNEFFFEGQIYSLSDREPDGLICDFCEKPMILNCWGGNYKIFNCPGCGQKIKRDTINLNNFEILANPGGVS
jgi:hypothetical protein